MQGADALAAAKRSDTARSDRPTTCPSREDEEKKTNIGVEQHRVSFGMGGRPGGGTGTINTREF